MEHKIGERFTYIGRERKPIKLQAKKAPRSDGRCAKCYFDNSFLSCIGYECDASKRSDHKNIIYKEIKEDK